MTAAGAGRNHFAMIKLPSLIAAILGALAFSAQAAVSPIHMTIDQHSDTKRPKAKPGHPSMSNLEQHRSLTIKLFNNSGEPFDHLVVKYFFLGHDLKDHKITVLQQGQRKSALAPRGGDTVDSEEVTNVYTEAHSEIANSKGHGKSNGGKSGKSAKKVPASGRKVIGYAVQVFNGNQIVAESYDNPSYKEIVGASAPSLSPDNNGAKKPAAKSPKKGAKKK